MKKLIQKWMNTIHSIFVTHSQSICKVRHVVHSLLQNSNDCQISACVVLIRQDETVILIPALFKLFDPHLQAAGTNISSNGTWYPTLKHGRSGTRLLF